MKVYLILYTLAHVPLGLELDQELPEPTGVVVRMESELACYGAARTVNALGNRDYEGKELNRPDEFTKIWEGTPGYVSQSLQLLAVCSHFNPYDEEIYGPSLTPQQRISLQQLTKEKTKKAFEEAKKKLDILLKDSQVAGPASPKPRAVDDKGTANVKP